MTMVSTWKALTPPTLQEELDLIRMLHAAATLVPESEMHGTPQYRVFIVGQHGVLIGGKKKERHPLIYELADKVSRFMGAGTGRWKEDQAFDAYPNNVVRLFKDVSSPWVPDQVQQTLWNYGVVYARSDNTSKFFYPAFTGVYSNETSILNGMINAMLCANLERVHFRVWTKLTGGQYSDANIVQSANLFVQDEVRDKYGSRFEIKPNAYLTESDIENGKSYHLDIDVYGNNPRVRFTYRPVAHRMSELG